MLKHISATHTSAQYTTSLCFTRGRAAESLRLPLPWPRLPFTFLNSKASSLCRWMGKLKACKPNTRYVQRHYMQWNHMGFWPREAERGQYGGAANSGFSLHLTLTDVPPEIQLSEIAYQKRMENNKYCEKETDRKRKKENAKSMKKINCWESWKSYKKWTKNMPLPSMFFSNQTEKWLCLWTRL